MAEASTNAPVPSKHIFLHELTKQPAMAKVRFLCCVIFYDLENGVLYVEHRYPIDIRPTPTAVVNIDLVRQDVSRDMLQVGSWLNVIGYVRHEAQTKNRKSNTIPEMSHSNRDVQAILMWSAGAIRLQEYEQILQKQKEVQRQLRATTQRD